MRSRQGSHTAYFSDIVPMAENLRHAQYWSMVPFADPENLG